MHRALPSLPIMLLLVFAAALSAGCSSRGGMIASFQDITTETRRHGMFYGRQYEAISIPGLLPSPDAGFLYVHNPRRFPMSKVGMSNSTSFILVRTMGANCTISQVTSLRDGIMDMRNLAENIVEMKFELAQDTLLKKQALHESLPEKEDRNEQSWITAWKNAETVGLNATALGVMKQALSNATASLATKETALYKLVNQPGIMLFRWNRLSESGARIDAANTAQAAYNDTRNGKGFAVVGGIRMSTMFVGTDILDKWSHAADIGLIRSYLPIPTSLIQAKYITYVSEVDATRSFSFKVSASGDEIKKLAKNWEEQLKLELEYYQARIESLSNTAFMGEGTINVLPVAWSDDSGGKNFYETVRAKYDEEEIWAGFYDVATPLNSLKIITGKPIVGPADK